MKYDEVMEYLEENVAILGSVMGLETLRELLERIGNPQKKLTFIHVAGTNGKGSVCTFLTEALIANGYRVGRYLSPVISDYREKIQVNNHFVTKVFVAKCLEELFAVSKQMVADGFAHPTAFELETAMAFAYFAEKRCDVVVLECGMGGLEDATNVIDAPVLTVFTEISMDHMAILGDTVAKIAKVKAGIIKTGSVVVSASQKAEAAEVLEESSKKCGVECDFVDSAQIKVRSVSVKGQRFTYRNHKDVRIHLLGRFQVENAALAMLALDKLKAGGFRLDDEKCRKGFLNARWTGRFEVLGRHPYVVLDGAHNEAAVRKLMDSVRDYFEGKRIVFVMGVLKDKDYSQMIKDSCSMAAYVVTVTPPIRDRALSAFTLAEEIRQYHTNVTAADSVEEALEMAMLLAGQDGVVLAFGSLSYLGAMKKAYEVQTKESGR